MAFLMALLVGSVGVASRQTGLGSLSGFVLAGADSCPVVYANIVLLGSRFGVMTDSTGYFQLESVPAGRYTVKVFAMYRPSLEFPDIIVVPNADTRREYLLEPFGSTLTLADAELESLGIDVHVTPRDVDCEITPQTEPFHVGDRPRFNVRIRNDGRQTVYLVPMLQCSGHTRYPRVNIAIEDPSDGFDEPQNACCTITQGLTEHEFRSIEPGAAFDPLDRVLTDVELHGQFTKPGAYVVQFEYSTDEPDVRRWYVSLVDGRVPSPVSRLIRRVPRIVLKDSVVVNVVQ